LAGGAEPPLDPLLDELGAEPGPEADALPEVPLVLVLEPVPLVCVPPVEEAAVVVEEAVPVLGEEASAQDAWAAGVIAVPGTASVAADEALGVTAATALDPALTTPEHVVAEPAPSCSPAAPVPDEVDLEWAPVTFAAPVAGAFTGPPASMSSLSLIWAALTAGRLALSASFGAVDTVASSAPAMAWIPLVGREPGKAARWFLSSTRVWPG
jgi:hypothetical protein